MEDASRQPVYDAVIVGGGPAGLSAALVLGRCRRRVIVCDEGQPRNRRAQAVHGFLTRDGTPPALLLELARDEFVPYGVELRRAEVADAARDGDGFAVTLRHGSRLNGRTLLLATRLGRDDRSELADHGIPVFEQAIARLEGRDGLLERIVFADGQSIARRALFFNTRQHHRSHLPAALGCPMTSKGTVKTGHLERAHVPGLYVAGDASRDVQFVVVAAAEGAKAAIAVNEELQARERRARRRGAFGERALP